MKELKLIKGCGRTGNFIICLLCAICHAKKYGFEKIDFSNVHWSPNPSISKKIISDFFKELEIIAKNKGFLLVSSSPLTRSSYHADEDFRKLQDARNKSLECRQHQ